jgi:trk system potassium uptake protein TrkH
VLSISRPPRRRRFTIGLQHPAQVVVVAFAVVIAIVTVALSLPIATRTGAAAPLRTALFTAVSSVCVTGLTLQDTASYWSSFGQSTILVGFQVGGFGIMTLASLLGLLVSRRLRLRTRVLAQAETRSLDLGDVRRVVRGVALISVSAEAALALALFLRLWLGYGERPGRAGYLGLFHAVSAFNNAGFVLWSDNFLRFSTDPWFLLPVVAGVLIGALGFPVLFELRRELRRPRDWSLHTKVTLLTTGLFVCGGWLTITLFEWSNPATLGRLPGPGRVLAGFFQGVVPRTAGFNTVDIAALRQPSLLVTDVLMFVGGGAASTAGGIKVTTFMILLFAILAEARGDDTVDAFGRRIPGVVLRQALTVALLSVAAVALGTLALLAISGLDLSPVLFESVSAFSTVGLTTGITASLPPAAQYVLIVLMYAGRVGPSTLAAALALRGRHRLYRFPEERPVIG